jgi:hypothetical protein
MTLLAISKHFRTSTIVLAMSAIFSPALFAQDSSLALAKLDPPTLDAPRPAIEAAPAVMVMPKTVTSFNGDSHKFWDTKNRALFATAAAFNGADFAITRANLQSGGQELNPMVRVFGRSTAGLAVNFVGETAGVVGLSYFFHKTGHHKMERMVSVVNIGGSAGAVGYGLAHR